MTGDGELQEGQIWESLIKVDIKNKNNLNIIVDNNKVQSDTYVKNVSDLGNLKLKFESFSCKVFEGNGHDYDFINSFANFKSNLPKVMIANTIKGNGVSFMEHTSMTEKEEYYKYHSGAPSAEEYSKASEILNRIEILSNSLKLQIPAPSKKYIQKKKTEINSEKMINSYSEYLLKYAEENTNVVAMDADLILDTGLIPFKHKYPTRYFQCGISEQDMVSQSGTMALSGLIPLVHSFSCFLTSRPIEQIYNNCLQGSKVIYLGSLSGLLPAGPGSSHQSVNDITSMASMGDINLFEPASSCQLDYILDFSINKTDSSSFYKINIYTVQKNYI